MIKVFCGSGRGGGGGSTLGYGVEENNIISYPGYGYNTSRFFIQYFF